jgi:hypothetical protein
VVELCATIRQMKAGTEIPRGWASPASASITEFEVDSAEEGFMSFSPALVPFIFIPAP